MTSIWTIGHSNQRLDSFLDLLVAHGIEILADVRSRPRSRWAHFNKKALSLRIEDSNRTYVWLPGLGGIPEKTELMLPDGSADFEAIRVSDDYVADLAELSSLAAERRIAVMCSEGDPLACHRSSVLAPDLVARGIDVQHILKDGTLLAHLI